MKIKNRATTNYIYNENIISASKTLDVTGQFCPQLIVDVDGMINAIKIGEIIEIISTDSATKSYVPDWCDNTGHILLESEFNKNLYRYRYLVQRVKKTQ